MSLVQSLTMFIEAFSPDHFDDDAEGIAYRQATVAGASYYERLRLFCRCEYGNLETFGPEGVVWLLEREINFPFGHIETALMVLGAYWSQGGMDITEEIRLLESAIPNPPKLLHYAATCNLPPHAIPEQIYQQILLWADQLGFLSLSAEAIERKLKITIDAHKGAKHDFFDAKEENRDTLENAQVLMSYQIYWALAMFYGLVLWHKGGPDIESERHPARFKDAWYRAYFLECSSDEDMRRSSARMLTKGLEVLRFIFSTWVKTGSEPNMDELFELIAPLFPRAARAYGVEPLPQE